MKFIAKIIAPIRRAITWFKNTRLRVKILSGAILVFVLIGLGFSLSGSSDEKKDTESLPTVKVQSARDIATTLDPLPLVGNVRSSTEATVLTEASGRVVGVYASLGQFVGRGALIAEIENSSERASVLQAEANLARVAGSSEDQQLESAAAGLASAQESSLATILSAFATTQDAIRQKADQTFTNPTNVAAQYTLNTTDSALEGRIESERANIQRILNRQQASGAVLTTQSNLDAELALTLEEMKSVRAYLDLLVDSINKAIPDSENSASDIAALQTSVTAGRTSVIATISSIASSKEALAAKRAALEVAENSLEQSSQGETRQDVLAAEASLAAARAQLEKKRIRAPFSGTINSLPLEVGSFVSTFEPAVTIANNGILEVRTYITERDKEFVSVGQVVTSVNGITGVITSVAPALDPITKRIEVRIALDENSGDITNGQSLRLLVERKDASVEVTTPIVPLTAITFQGNDPYVFGVSTENTLIALPVELGTIIGERIEVFGIDIDLPIVVDARGFIAGEKVTVE